MAQPTKGESQFADRNDNPMLSAQGSAITAISVTGTYATDDTPIETAINGIISVLEAHGLIADN